MPKTKEKIDQNVYIEELSLKSVELNSFFLREKEKEKKCVKKSGGGP